MALHIYRITLIALFITMGFIVATTPAHSKTKLLDEATSCNCTFLFYEIE